MVRVASCRLILAPIFAFWFVLGFSQESNDIGYESVAEALEALRANPNAKIFKDARWTKANVWTSAGIEIWSFVPRSHSAYPSAIKDTLVFLPAVSSDRDVLCEASEEACDSLIRELAEKQGHIRERLEEALSDPRKVEE